MHHFGSEALSRFVAERHYSWVESYMEWLEGKQERAQYHTLLEEELASLRGWASSYLGSFLRKHATPATERSQPIDPICDRAWGGEMLRVLVVDDRIDFRMAFCGLLEGQTDLKVVAQAGSLAEARTMLEGVDVALLDRGLPDGDGLELMGPLRAVNPGARVFVISSTAEMIHPKDAIEAGADGVIDKLDRPERVFGAIRGEGGG
jgi:CheY-like chemotaxis protein